MGDAIAVACFAITASLAVAASIEDYRTHLLRNVYTLPIAVIGAIGLGVAANLNNTSPDTYKDMAIGAAWFGGTWLITHLVAPKQIGFGDVKLSLGLGLYLGYLNPNLGFYGLIAAAAIFGLANLATKAEAKAAVPFGPAITAGWAIAAAVGIFT